MLKPAIEYKDQLEACDRKIWFNEKYKYFNTQGQFGPFEVNKDSSKALEFASVNQEGEVVGYIACGIDQRTYSGNGMCIISFCDDIMTFGADIRTAIRDLFCKYNFYKLNFSVVVGNPAEKHYDKLVNLYSGRVVGTYKDDVRLMDGKIYDLKVYEITKEEYLRGLKKIAPVQESKTEITYWADGNIVSERSTKNHCIKIQPQFFEAVMRGDKRFELRKNDRDYRVGEAFKLQEYAEGEFTGRCFREVIKYVLKDCPEYGLKDGYCIFGW